MKQIFGKTTPLGVLPAEVLLVNPMDAALLAETIIHEYTHVAVNSIFLNEGFPWINGGPSEGSYPRYVFDNTSPTSERQSASWQTFYTTIATTQPILANKIKGFIRDWSGYNTGAAARDGLIKEMPAYAVKIAFGIQFSGWRDWDNVTNQPYVNWIAWLQGLLEDNFRAPALAFLASVPT